MYSKGIMSTGLPFEEAKKLLDDLRAKKEHENASEENREENDNEEDNSENN